MRNRHASLVLLFLSVLTFTACQQRLYFPDRANSPGLTEAYEVKGTISIKPHPRETDSAGRVSGNQGSMAADIAFAPAEHLGILVSYRSLNHRFIDQEGDLFADKYGGDFFGNRLEGGVGYWNTMGRKGRFELYAGYGNGTMKRRGQNGAQKDYNTRYHRFFLQPALGVGNDVFQLMGGIRFAFHKFYNFTSPSDTLRRYIMRDANGYTDVENEITGFIEPYVNMEVGYQYVKFNLQLGFTGQYVGLNVAGNLPGYVSIGATFSYAPRYANAGGSSRRGMDDVR